MFHWLTRRGFSPRAMTLLLAVSLTSFLASGCGSGGGPSGPREPDEPDPIPNFLPAVTIVSVELDGGLVEVCFSIADGNSDLVDILTEFSTNAGVTFRQASEELVVPSEGRLDLSSSPTGVVHCFVWDPGADGVGVANPANVIFRVTPHDGIAVGTPGVSETFVVDNPAVVVDVGTTTALFGAVALQVPLRMTGNGTQPVSVSVEVSFDEEIIAPNAIAAVVGPAATAAGATVTAINTAIDGRITLTVSGPSVISDGIIAFLQFDAFVPVTPSPITTPVFCIDVSAINLSLQPLAAACGLNGAVFLTPNLAPSCSITAPVGGTVFSSATMFTGDVQVDYTLVDAEGDFVDVTVEFSSNGGVSFQPASEVVGAPSEGTVALSATPGGVAHIFVWDADADITTLTTMAENVVLRISATDVSTGTPCLSGSFVVDLRNAPPQCSPMTLATVGASGNIMITFSVTDVESDLVDIVFQYSNGGPFLTATAAVGSPFMSPALSQVTPITSQTFIWNSSLDLGPVMAVVSFRITAGDASNPVIPTFGPQVTSCTSGAFAVDNTARVFNSLEILGPGSALGAGANAVGGGYTPLDPCNIDITATDFTFSQGVNRGRLTSAVSLLAGANPLIFTSDGLTAQLVVQGNFAGLGSPTADLAMATTADGATTYNLNPGAGGPYTSVGANGLVTALLVGAAGQSGCDQIDVTFTPNGMGMAGGSNGAPMTTSFAACIDYWGYDQTSRMTALANGDLDATIFGLPSGTAAPGVGGMGATIYIGRSAPNQDPAAFEFIVTYDPAQLAPDQTFGNTGVAVCNTPPILGPWTTVSNPMLAPNMWLVNGFRVIGGAPQPAAQIESICALGWTRVGAGSQVMTSLVNFWADSATMPIVGTQTPPYVGPGLSAGFSVP